jgi:hypothetical protein
LCEAVSAVIENKDSDPLSALLAIKLLKDCMDVRGPLFKDVLQ